MSGIKSQLPAIQEAAQIAVAVHADLQDEFSLIKARKAELYEVWQSKGTATKHQALMDRFDQAFLAAQQEIEEIKQMIDRWGITVEAGTAEGERILNEAEQLAGSGVPGTAPAPASGGAGGYLELITSGETVAGGQAPAAPTQQLVS